jgi:hypothetical protein
VLEITVMICWAVWAWAAGSLGIELVTSSRGNEPPPTRAHGCQTATRGWPPFTPDATMPAYNRLGRRAGFAQATMRGGLLGPAGQRLPLALPAAASV